MRKRNFLPSAIARRAVASVSLEPLEMRFLLATFWVTSVNDSGAGSLRQAILDANKTPGADVIKFNIASGARTITPASPLPWLSEAVTIDGTSQNGYAGKPLIEINGSKAGSSANGFSISGNNVTLKGLAINRFGGMGVMVLGKGSNTIANCYIGTDLSGTVAAPNGSHGILVQSPNNLISGSVISGNTEFGVFLYTSAATGNRVQGNFIGTDVTGTKALGNRNGVGMNGAPKNTIGGTVAGARNVISGNRHNGVLINISGASGNVIQGNFIGTNASGTAALGNHRYGVEISQPNNIVGGIGAGRNIISGNGLSGVVLYLSSASGNFVQGNFIGTDVTGTRPLSNKTRGVEMTNGAQNNHVGGNLISGNSLGGVGIYSGSRRNLIAGNLIGTTITGMSALGNGTGAGVTVTDNAGTNTIGGLGPAYRNIISGNHQGIALSGSPSGTVIQGNYIGVNATGTAKLGNATDGIYIGTANNTVGGTNVRARNLISGSGGDGIRINGHGNNTIRRNYVGVDLNGRALGNGNNGIFFVNSSGSVVQQNLVAHNAKHGVQVGSGVRNALVSNAIYSNVGVQINLGWGDYPTPNGPAVRSGANNLLNTPVISTASRSGSSTIVGGSLLGPSNAAYRIEFFASPTTASNGQGEGRVFLGFVRTSTDGSGKATFAAVVPTVAAGWYITATATTLDGNTSEFAKPVRV